MGEEPGPDLFENIDLSEDTLASFDIALIITDHTSFDYELIKENSKQIIDTRGVFSIEKDKIYRA